MIWLLLQQPGGFQSAAVCAYTWPEIPRMLRRHGCEIGFFDFGQKDVLNLVTRLPGTCLVVVPVFYGFPPWIDHVALGHALGNRAFVLLDAAQTAFGFEQFAPAPGGAVMSCPHKATAVNDGAVLVVDRITPAQVQEQRQLQPGEEFHRLKKRARMLLSSGNEQGEAEGLETVRRLEEAWCSDPPERMTDESLETLMWLDPNAHADIRRKNRQRLRERLDGLLKTVNETDAGVPFAHAVRTRKRDQLLKILHAERVFATPLWPDAIHDQVEHPTAALLATELLALPVDQRYSVADMDVLADTVIACV